MSVKVGIWGVGFMGAQHGRILKRDTRVELSAIYDLDAERCKSVADELGCAAAASEDALLDSCEAVFIAVPNTLHAEAARQALAAGKHIYLEKPFAVTLEDARDVRDRAMDSGKVFMVGHNRRFAPVYRRVRELIHQAGWEPASAMFKMNRGELQRPAWTGDPKVTGGYLFETPYHLFDLARWLFSDRFGEIADIQVAASKKVYDELDNFSLLFRFERDFALTFTTVAHTGWHYPFERIEVYGDHRTIETREMDSLHITEGTDQPPITKDEDLKLSIPATEERWGYLASDAQFISDVLGELPADAPRVTAEDGFRAVEIVSRIYAIAGS